MLTNEEFVVPPCGMGYVWGEVPIVGRWLELVWLLEMQQRGIL